ncbi:Thiamin pyrophosphokinase, catalytic domain [Syntrophomonas zehnderi OL-4]|uniref:Thiamin pyrophosphokinase, catalytic domain n=1 Tax=Syntrophomonas zehnderi OL-4 TaxID=690567 RepID=A0A0E4C8H8_9FIRM|nr:putative cytokinetic ring protein SteA [Syntrophomonas zehnderi]CFX50412.1 Thiamin pyrophosphokinase, catalytic domain [Syntrophomonas zehnderi OL-4]
MHLKGKAKLDKRTKNLVNRLRKGDIAVISHDDIDEVAANSLIDIRPIAILNTMPSITGRYPARGAYKILKAGIPIIDEVPEKIFEDVKEGTLLEIKDGTVISGSHILGEGKVLTLADVNQKLDEANENIKQELDDFVDNTLEYAKKEKDVLLGNLEVPPLNTHILNRHVLIVVRGSSYKEDLRAIYSYIQEQKPVLIGVDGGADALMEFNLKPDIIVGDMDSVSDEALQSGAEIVVHAYANGKAPGLERVESMGIEPLVFAVPGTSEDIAMILAWEYGASLIVAVGTHSNMIDFLEKGRKGMASTFLVRLKVGSILIDARGVSQLYKQSLHSKYLAQLFMAALIPITILLWVSPATQPFFRLIWLQIKILVNSI